MKTNENWSVILETKLSTWIQRISENKSFQNLIIFLVTYEERVASLLHFIVFVVGKKSYNNMIEQQKITATTATQKQNQICIAGCLYHHVGYIIFMPNS